MAALSIACPVAEISCPAPDTVWQALKRGAETVNTKIVKAKAARVLDMVLSPLC